jgi:glycolate oxidase iron-sulfur subunit
VVYHELIEETRARIDHASKRKTSPALLRFAVFNLFTRPTRLKLALLPARVLQKLGVYRGLRLAGAFRFLPRTLRRMEQLLPAQGPLWPKMPAEVTEPMQGGPARCTVALLVGCVGQVMFDAVNRKSIELLARCGARVIVPRTQACCGAIHHHNADHASATGFARQNLDAFLPQGHAVDYVVTNIAGCGAMLRDYAHLMRDEPEATRAQNFALKVRDISEVLLELGLPDRLERVELKATYHDACHLAHAQRVTTAPRQLLSRVPGLELVPLIENDMCCGAAGTYNLAEPEMADRLGVRKVGHIVATGAAACVTGNVGCATHIAAQARARGDSFAVLHPVDLLHAAVFGAR